MESGMMFCLVEAKCYNSDIKTTERQYGYEMKTGFIAKHALRLSVTQQKCAQSRRERISEKR